MGTVWECFLAADTGRNLREDIGFRCWQRGTTGFPTISDFRKQHLAALQGLLIKCCRSRAGGDDEAGTGVLDGSKVKANAEQAQAMSYGRMKEERTLKRRGEAVIGAGEARMQKRIRATDGIRQEMNCRRSWGDGRRE